MAPKKSYIGLMCVVLVSVLIIFTSCTDTSDDIQDISEDLASTDSSTDSAEENNVFFVSLEGNDQSGTGGEDAPFATIQHAVDEASEGYTIIVKGGTYTDQGEIKIEKENITIKSEEGEQVFIQAPYDDEDISFCFWITQEASGCKLIGLDISGGNYYGIKLDSDWDWDKSLPYDERTGASNILIENCSIHDTGADVIKITPGCDDVTIRNCEIYNSGLIVDDNAEGIDNVNGDRMLVENCHIYDIATNGIYFKGGATGCVIDSTLVERCGESGILAGFDTSVEWFDLDANPEYYEAIDGTIQNCIIRNTVYAGIGLYASQNTHIINNTIINTAAVGQAPIYFGIAYQDWEPEAGRPSNVDPLIVNNIVYQTECVSIPVISIRYSDDLGGLSALEGEAVIDYNCYFTGCTVPLFEDNRPETEYSGDLSEWQTKTGADINSMIANPLLNNLGHLMEGSPCIDMGSGDIYPDYDYDSDERQGLPDIGADEFTAQ